MHQVYSLHHIVNISMRLSLRVASQAQDGYRRPRTGIASER